MVPKERLRVLLIAPYYDRGTPSESWSTYKWVSGIAPLHDTTVLTSHSPGWQASNSPVDAKEIVNWTDPVIPRALRYVDYNMKPQYALFVARARRWFRQRRAEGADFDLVHQVSPLALRYPYPLLGSRIPYILGPLGGSLSTPPGFRQESDHHVWYFRFRGLDELRIRRDPWLRGSYEGASLVLGVAPYVGNVLSAIRISRFEVMSETGVDNIGATPKRPPAPGEPLRLLFVGRVFRTKGVIDAIRAIALAAARHSVEFNIVGGGPMLEACKEEARLLGVDHIVKFHGRVPREEVTRWYERSHVFLFPSYREASGNVVFEAMNHGLPVIACNAGGPGYVVTNECGVSVEPTNPSEYPAALARAITEIASDLEDYPRRSAAALARIEEVASWPRNVARLSALYDDVVASANGHRPSGRG